MNEMGHCHHTATNRLRIEYVRVEELKRWARNPRRIASQQLAALKANIESYGIVDPIIVNRSNIIIGGHQRLDAAQALGMKRVPVVRVDVKGKDLETLNLALNRISGDWDEDKLAPILEELQSLPEFDLTGFQTGEANVIIGSLDCPNPGERDDVAVQAPHGLETKPGEMWKLGNHRLLCADAANPESWHYLMNDRKADLIVTDPPYGASFHMTSKFEQHPTSHRYLGPRKWERLKGDEDTHTAIQAMPQIFANLAEHGSGYICCGSRLLLELANWLQEKGIYFAPFLVWLKSQPVPTWHRYHYRHENILFCGNGAKPTGALSRWFGPKNENSVWEIDIDPTLERMHPTQKPVQLYERAICNSSRKGELLLDPFAGSGTCLIASQKHNRRCLAMELEPRYCSLAVARWEAYTNQKAEKVSFPT